METKKVMHIILCPRCGKPLLRSMEGTCVEIDARWERLTAEYRRAGMTEKQIAAMRSYDWKEFKRERIFRIHNQFL